MLDLVKRKIKAEALAAQQLVQFDAMVKFYRQDTNTILSYSPASTSNREELTVTEVLSDWRKNSLSAVTSIAESSPSKHPIVLQKSKQQFERIWTKRNALQELAILKAPELEPQFHQIREKWGNPRAIFKSREELLQIKASIKGTLSNHEILSDRLIEFISDYTHKIQSDAKNLNQLIRIEFSNRTKILTIAFVFILLISALVFFYVNHHVVSRIQALGRKIRGYSKDITGSEQPLKTDEIEEIEASFDYFYSSIKKREAELRDLGEIAAIERDNAEAANRSKIRLLKAVSHDLRQPLHAMALFLSSLKKQIKTSHGHELHDALVSSVDEMGSTFDTILDLSGTQNGEGIPDRKDFFLSEIFIRIETEFTMSANNAGNNLTTAANNLTACSDPEAIYRIISNLVTNAIRYAPGSEIKLCASKSETDITISVSDTGPGICQTQKSEIFKDNYRLSDIEGGRGMGLAIAQELVLSLGSNLTVRDNKPNGAIFEFKIPTGKSTRVTAKPDTHDKITLSNLDGLEAIVVEDDKSVAQATKVLLESWGCTVQCYHSAEHSFDKTDIDSQRSILLTDLHLGRSGNGLALAQEFAKTIGVPNRVIVVSADHAAKTRASVQESGFYFIRKPFTPAQLATTLRSINRQG